MASHKKVRSGKLSFLRGIISFFSHFCAKSYFSSTFSCSKNKKKTEDKDPHAPNYYSTLQTNLENAKEERISP